MKQTLLIASAVVLLLAAAASAQTVQNGAGTLALGGQVDGSLSLILNQDSNGASFLTGDGTPTATMTYGEVSYYGTANGLLGSKFTKTSDGSGFTLTTTFDITVNEANLPSSESCHVTAQMNGPDGLTWSVNSTTVTSASATSVITGLAYATKTPYPMAVTIPITQDHANLNNTFNFTAIPD